MRRDPLAELAAAARMAEFSRFLLVPLAMRRAQWAGARQVISAILGPAGPEPLHRRRKRR